MSLKYANSFEDGLVFDLDVGARELAYRHGVPWHMITERHGVADDPNWDYQWCRRTLRIVAGCVLATPVLDLHHDEGSRLRDRIHRLINSPGIEESHDLPLLHRAAEAFDRLARMEIQ